MAGQPRRRVSHSFSKTHIEKSFFGAIVLCCIAVSCTPAPDRKKQAVFVKGVPIIKTKLPKFFPITYRELEITIDPGTLKIGLEKLVFPKNSEAWELLRDNEVELYTIASRDQTRFRKTIRKADKKEFERVRKHLVKKGSSISFLPFLAPETNSLGIPQITFSDPAYNQKFISIKMTFWRRNPGSYKPDKDLMPKLSLTLTFSPEEHLIVLPSKNAITRLGGQLKKAPVGKFRLLAFFFEKPLVPLPRK